MTKHCLHCGSEFSKSAGYSVSRWLTSAKFCSKQCSTSAPRKKRVSDCHPDRPHKAKGLCLPCYRRNGPGPLWHHNNYITNRTRLLDHGKQYRADNKNVLTDRRFLVKLRVLANYSLGQMCCACCGEQQIEFLSIDHIQGGGGAERKMIGGGNCIYASLNRRNMPGPERYQVLCHNCNQAKGSHGRCPHGDR